MNRAGITTPLAVVGATRAFMAAPRSSGRQLRAFSDSRPMERKFILLTRRSLPSRCKVNENWAAHRPGYFEDSGLGHRPI
jgi:hypothetical protein